MKKFLIFALLTLALCLASHGQRAAVKLSLGNLLIGDVAVSGEYRTADKQSLQVQVGYLIPRDLSGFAESLFGDPFPPLNISSLAITPEYRFYVSPFKSSEHLSGFYIAPLLRYRNWRLSTDFIVEGIPAGASIGANNYRGGVQIGLQWALGGHFVIDWYLAGVTAGVNVLRGEINAAQPIADVEAIQREIEARYGELPIDLTELGLEGQLQSFSFRSPSAGLGLRTGLSLGVAF